MSVEVQGVMIHAVVCCQWTGLRKSYNESMSEKTFTLEEADFLLPILESLLRQAMDAKDDILITEKEFSDLGHRIFLSGGLLLDVEHWAKRKAVRERAV